MKGYRTLAFGVLVAVFGVLQSFDWSTVIHDPRVLGLVTTAIGMAVVGLRSITSTPVGRSQ